MVGIVAVIVKVMPESPETDFEKLKVSVRDVLEREGTQNITFEERPMAFGLKALIVKMAWPEEKDTDLIEQGLKEVEGVSAVDIEDYRRAFG